MANKRIYDLTEDTTPSSGDFLATDKSGNVEATKVDIAKFAILAGQAGGQTLYGGTAAGDDLTLAGTSHGTPGYVLLQPTGGYVGIGTNAPASVLHVKGANVAIGAGFNSFGNLLVSTTNEMGINLGGSLVLGGRYTTGSEGITAFATIHGKKTNASNGDPTGYMAFETADGVGTLSSEKMRITTAGNVGIGTTAPDSLLHVSLSDSGTNTATQVVTISHNGGTPTTGFGSRILWELESSTTDDQAAAALDVAWNIATHATRTSRIVLSTITLGAPSTFLHNYADATADGDNTFLGIYAGNSTLSPGGGASSLASANVAVGGFSQYSLTTGYQNTSVGKGSTVYVTTGYRNTAVGAYTLNACTTGYGNVALGIAAGFYETGSNKLFIDNAQRASEADGRAKALIYGVFDAATANQTLALNGVVTVLEGLKVTNGSVQIGGTAARSGTAGTNRLDIFDGTAPTGNLANGISIYSSSGECYIMDATSNATLQSPHDPETGEWIFWSKNMRTGRTYRVDMERMVAAIESLTGQSFTTETFESLN